MSNQYLSFDVTKQSEPQELITGRQGDSQLKFVTMLFWDGDKNVPYDLTGKQVAFEALKPDNTHIVDYEGITILDAPAGLVRYSFNEQVFSVAGTMQQAFFKITHTDSDNNVIADSTLEVAINILENRVEFGINSKDYLSEYDDLIAQVKKKFDDYAATVKDSIDKAQALHDQIVEYTNLINSKGVILSSDFGDISSIRQPFGKTFVDKLNNEFNDRGVNVAWYGAKGDGVTDDTESIKQAVAEIESRNGGTLFFPAGTYIIGNQKLANANGLSYSGQHVISPSKSLPYFGIKGENATLKMRDGLHVGKFDANGNPSNNGLQALVGNIININNAGVVEISGLEIDGGLENMTIGGPVGIGEELSAHGINIYGYNRVLISNVHVHHCACDGILLGDVNDRTKPDENQRNKPAVIINVDSEFNARQGLSVTGGTGITIMNSKFNNTGKGGLSISPAAGIDFEGNDGEVQNIYVVNCEFANNDGFGINGDPGSTRSVSFMRCRFFGTTNPSIYVSRPDYVFRDCLFSGEAMRFGNYADNFKRTRFEHCLFTADQFYDSTHTMFGITLIEARHHNNDPASNPIFVNCKIQSSNPAFELFKTEDSNTIFKDCTFERNYSSNVIYRATFIGHNEFITPKGETSGINFNNSKNDGVIAIYGMEIVDKICGANSIWYSPHGTLNNWGVNSITGLPNDSYFTIRAREKNTGNYLIATGYLGDSDTYPVIKTLASNVLALGSANKFGSQEITGWINVNNAEISTVIDRLTI